MSRLIKLKKYLAEAELDADSNKLYIDDLKLSIGYEQTKITYEAMVYDKHLIGAFSNQQD